VTSTSPKKGGLGPIFLTVFVDVLALTLVLPLLPYYATTFGASEVQIGALLASFSVCQLISSPLLGRLSDRFGRKPVLLVSQAGTMVGLLLLGGATNLWWLFAGRILDGFTAGNLTIAQAAITDATEPKNRTKAYAFFGIAFGVGFLVGPAFSGWLAKNHGFHAPPFCAAALSLSSILLTAWLFPSHPPAGTANRVSLREALRRVLAQPAARRSVLEMFMYVLSFSMLTGGLALFLRARLDFDVDQVGYAFAFSGLVGALAQGGIGRLAKRLGERQLSAGGIAFMAVGYVLLARVEGVLSLGLALAVGGLGSAVVRPALTTLLTNAVDEGERGLALGVSQSASSLAQSMGPVIAGALIGAGALGTWALVAATFAGGVLVVRWLFSRTSV
jgi:MFS transporter, DHA1 family, tetracycline resistance protein